MTAAQIKEIALKHFALNGYEGTSMSHIADNIGIKKQSIYTHFKGKDELFLQVCEDVFENELKIVRDFTEKHGSIPVEEFLHGFLLHFQELYEKSEHTKFLLRVSFFPPVHLYEQVINYVYTYLDRVELLLIPVMEKAIKSGEIKSDIDAGKAAAAFLGLLDSIFVEMLYGGPVRVKKRMDTSWHIFWLGLSKA